MRAACGCRETAPDFVPQGLVVRGNSGWVSGYDEGDGEVGNDTCRIVRLDLRTGAEIAQRAPIQAELAPRGPANCRHAGGLSLDRARAVGLPVHQGLAARPGDAGRPTGVAPARPGAGLATWCTTTRAGSASAASTATTAGRCTGSEPATLFEPGRLDLGPEDAADVQPGPPAAQGAVCADLGPGPARVWFTRSNTYCSELWARPNLRFAFLPGAEGVAYARGRVWVVSETTAAPYFLDGGRPVVPTSAAVRRPRPRALGTVGLRSLKMTTTRPP